jgi:hypothetical protein
MPHSRVIDVRRERRGGSGWEGGRGRPPLRDSCEGGGAIPDGRADEDESFAWVRRDANAGPGVRWSAPTPDNSRVPPQFAADGMLTDGAHREDKVSAFAAGKEIVRLGS